MSNTETTSNTSTFIVWGEGSSNLAALRTADPVDGDDMIYALSHGCDFDLSLGRVGSEWMVVAQADPNDLDHDDAVIGYCRYDVDGIVIAGEVQFAVDTSVRENRTVDVELKSGTAQQYMDAIRARPDFDDEADFIADASNPAPSTAGRIFDAWGIASRSWRLHVRY